MSLFSRYSEWYHFARGPQIWGYTSDSTPIVYGGVAYQSAPIKRGKLSESTDAGRNTLDLDVPTALPVLDQFRGTSPMGHVHLLLYRRRKGAEAVEIRWQGAIGSVQFKPKGITMIHCLPPTALLSTNGLNRRWTKQCDRVLGSAGLGECNVDLERFRIDATIIDVAGRVVTAAAFGSKPDGWFTAGELVWTTPNGGQERRFITEHKGTSLTLLTPALLATGTVVASYPGCDHTMATCDTTFGNSPNYGGQLNKPTKNPYGNEPIY
ncbi:MAG: hypothetical protein GAK28_00686 [Luteibacter sp.]|uniref:phage BR0599 family protein n=1 Tax=Luteibacter sp. TaxID=1886636 RepID=UPI0013863B14|nr:phage BR0599 family protein [Luteibacter sp.]KAF1009053.1 MAG: hypothetical protein GAK28_00686 [Luteibacter sp.]